MIVVSNTTPLIGLASIERFDLLRQMFGDITIAQAVYDEAVVAGREMGGAKREVMNATHSVCCSRPSKSVSSPLSVLTSSA